MGIIDFSNYVGNLTAFCYISNARILYTCPYYQSEEIHYLWMKSMPS